MPFPCGRRLSNMHYKYDIDSSTIRRIIGAASDAKDYRDYALSSVLFALLAIAYGMGKVDLCVVYESASGTLPSQPADFSRERLQTIYGADLVTFYTSDDLQMRKGLNIPVPYLSGKA
jgi:hypothetical protein